MNYRRIARFTYLAVFVAVEYGTDLFSQYPPLLWVGLFGLVVVFFDAVVCARRNWRDLQSGLDGDGEESDPSGN